MLGKLLKYEFNATSRTFLPMYIALLLVAVINRCFRTIDIKTGFGISMVLIVGLFMALGIVTFVVIIQRFNKNLLGDEGYLMFTLPVKVPELIFSKLISSFFWNVVSGFVSFITFLILVGDKEFFKDLVTGVNRGWEAFSEVAMQEFGVSPQIMIILGILLVVFGYTAFIFQIYLSLATAQLPIFNKHRGIIAFVSFFVINVVITIVSAIIGKILPSGIFNQFVPANIYLCVYCAIISGLFYAGTHYILSKHLNLE